MDHESSTVRHRVVLGDTVQFAIPSKEGEDDPRTPDPPEENTEFEGSGGSWGTSKGSGSAGVSSGSAPGAHRRQSAGHPGPSPAFLAVVEQLVQQHQVELTLAKTQSRKMKSFDLPAANTQDMERLVSCSSNAYGSYGRKSEGSQHSLKSGSQGSLPKGMLQRSGTVAAKVMCERNHDLKELNASLLLEAFDEKALIEEEQEERKKDRLSYAKTNASFATFDWDEMEKETWFTRCQIFLQSTRYEFLIAAVLALNVLWMAVELEVMGSNSGHVLGVYDRAIPNFEMWRGAFLVGDSVFAYIFIVDVLVRVSVLRRKFFTVCLNYVDVAVSMTSLAEVLLGAIGGGSMPVSPVLFKLLRIGKLARAIRMITMSTMLLSLQLLIKCLAASRGMLFWSFCLLSFVQCVAGMILSALTQDFINDLTRDAKVREDVFRYYGTFTRTFLSMFEILFANWSPACRVLVENVSEWFSVFFLLYRCVLGFAVINVVNSVFVQQTMKTASSDEDLAFRQKEKDIVAYTRKVRKLFQTMDSGGDGTINSEEFSKLVTNPKLNFWMSQLELEYHDLMSLFEFLDNGDGEITLSEFIEGAARLRGQAKALDIWRMETKVEVLFEEVLHLLRGPGISPFTDSPTSPASPTPDASAEITRIASIQNIFENSPYKHIRSSIAQRNDDNEPGHTFPTPKGI